MDNHSETGMPDKDLVFFSKISASVSHELNNVISIVNELAGLIEDLLLDSQEQEPVPPEKLKTITGNILNQIDRGRNIIKRLNRFSHGVDEPLSTIDINQATDDICFLARRFAKLKNVKLETQLAEDSILAISNPFILQHAIFSCISISLDDSRPEDTVTVSIRRAGPRAEIIVRHQPPLAPETIEAENKNLSMLMKSISGEAECITDGNENESFKLSIPLKT